MKEEHKKEARVGAKICALINTFPPGGPGLAMMWKGNLVNCVIWYSENKYQLQKCNYFFLVSLSQNIF